MGTKDLSIDKKEENLGLDITPVSDVLAEPESSLVADSNPKNRAFVSRGEKIHKWGTYLSIDWIFNAATGVGFAYWGKYTDLGKKIWSGPITEGFTKILKPFIKNPEYLKKSVGKGNMFMSIIAGGMFTIPPLMILENNKIRKSIIKYFDAIIYGKDRVENDPKFQTAYDEIDHAPKKDFAGGMASRFIALAPLLAMVLIPASRKISDKFWFDHVSKASEFTANKMGFREKSFKSIPLAEGKERWKFIHDSVAMDFGLGVPYAIMHAFFYNMFASKKEKENEANDITETAPGLAKSQLSSVPMEAAENAKQWTDETSFAEKHKPGTRLSDKVPDNFVDKVGNKSNGELQIV